MNNYNSLFLTWAKDKHNEKGTREDSLVIAMDNCKVFISATQEINNWTSKERENE
jgi:hypothetical protein